MGVSGCGKTSVGLGITRVIQNKQVVFLDADDFHPPENKTKMANGFPLNDDDRLPWLLELHKQLKEKSEHGYVVLACSALKNSYRKILACGQGDEPAVPILFVFLSGSFSTICERITARTGHFMDPSLLQSQFDTLEIPSPTEYALIVVNVDELTVDEIVSLVIQKAQLPIE